MCLTWWHTVILPMEICKSLVTCCSKLNMALPAFCDGEFWEFTFVGMAFTASYNFSSKWIIKNALFLLFPIKMSNSSFSLSLTGIRELQEGTQQQVPSTAPSECTWIWGFQPDKFCIFQCKTTTGEAARGPTCARKSNTPGLAWQGDDSTQIPHWALQGLGTKLIWTDGLRKI